MVLHRKDERVFPPRVSVSLKGEQAVDVFTESGARFINCLPSLHHLAFHPIDGSDHAAYSHRGNEALDIERSTTSWSAKARGLHTSECREARDPTAKGCGPASQARRFSDMMCRLVMCECFHQAREHGFPPFLPPCRKSAEAHWQGSRGFLW